jgi:hypothetical protein
MLPRRGRRGVEEAGRVVGQCEVGRREVGMRRVRSHGVGRAVRGRTGGAGSDEWRGRGGHARRVDRLGAQLVGWTVRFR